MKKVLFILLTAIAVSWYIAACKETKPVNSADDARTTLLKQVDELDHFIVDSFIHALDKNSESRLLQQQFLQTRSLYKRIEWAAEYFMPGTTRFVNGAPLPEVEVEEHIVKEPEGLQVIEGMLFPEMTADNKVELKRQLLLLKSNCQRYKDYFNRISFDDMQVWDAARLEVFRVITMGITGFDTPLVQTGIHESAIALRSVRALVNNSSSGKLERVVDSLFVNAIQELESSNSFNDFDRAAFIVHWATPLCRALHQLQAALKIPFVKDDNRLLRSTAQSLFDTDVFNPDAFVPDSSYWMNAAKIALGKRLFEDPILSRGNQRSCSSCHNPALAYTDGLAKNTVLDGAHQLLRNTPTLLNASLQAAQFYDLRATILENQAMTVIANKDEMHGNLDEAVGKLSRDTSYQRLFEKAFPNNNNQIQTAHITNALGSFIRSLTKLNSRFDEYMRGNKMAMNQEEIIGFNIFTGKGKCATCHFIPLFNGTVPPSFKKTESEVIGVPASPSAKVIDGDKGRYLITDVDPFMHAFKTTTVRNASLTAPYMHNGIYHSLEEVVDFYDKGGGIGLGFEVANQTLPFDKLSLTDTEKKAVIAFIKTLDSR